MTEDLMPVVLTPPPCSSAPSSSVPAGREWRLRCTILRAAVAPSILPTAVSSVTNNACTPDAAKARRHLLIRAHAQTHEEDEKIDEQIRQRVQKVKFVCMAAQLACNEVAGDHNGPVECEHCHEREPSFRRVAAKIEKGRRVIRAALCCFGRIGKYQARVLTQAEYLARFASRSCASAPLVRM